MKSDHYFYPAVKCYTLHFIAAAIVVLYAGYQTSLWGKERDWSLLQTNDTLALFLKNTRVGTLYYTTTVNDKKRCITVYSHVAISPGTGVPGNVSSMELLEIREHDFNGEQTRAFQELKSPSGTSTWELFTDKGKWILSVSAGGIKRSLPVANVTGNLSVAYEIQSAIVNKTAAVGDEWQDTVYDLTAATHRVTTIKCTAVPGNNNPYYVFNNHDSMLGMDERWEVDTKGKTVLQEVPPIFVAKRVAGEDAGRQTTSSTPLSFETLAELFKVSVDRAQKGNETIAITLSTEARLHKSTHRFYEQKDNVYVLKNLQETCTDRSVTAPGTVKSEWLKSTVTIQSDNPEIIALSKKLQGKMKSRCKIIKRFSDYLYKNIKKEHVASFSNAYETLKAGRGDCGEHAALLAALLRAAGIEANVVLGLVYISYRKGYFYHAWVAAYADNLVFVDPALGEFPAPAGYVPLVLDDNGTHIVHLASLIDRISISYERR